MAISLFQGNNLTVVSDGPEVDNKTGEYHTFSATPTRFMIESGSVASDHIIENPDGLEVTWVMSNLDADGQSYGNRAATFLDSLRQLIKSRQLFQVVTRHRLYPSMAIEAVTADHIGPFTGSLRGRIVFSEVAVGTLERSKVPAARVGRTVKKTASSQVNGGRVEPKPSTAPEKAKASTSLIKQLTGR